MDTGRGLGRSELWRKSFERRKRRRLILGVTGTATVAALVAALPAAVADGGARVVAPARYTHPVNGGAVYSHIDPPRHARHFGRHVARRPGTCPLLAQPAGYVNPLARARVTPERIDQGVDYAGSGTLTAIGTARVTHVGTSGTGWPGDFIEYRLLDGADSGCYVYYAEGVTPVTGLRVGQTVHRGQAIAKIIRWYQTGIEVGWGAGTGTTSYAAKHGKWTATDDADNIPTSAGERFSALIASLRGPPGKKEGVAPSGAGP